MKTIISDLTTKEAISLLKEIGDGQTASSLKDILDEAPELGNVNVANLPKNIKLPNAKWRGTEHTYGYIQMDNDEDDFHKIVPATTLSPDESLKNKRVNIKLGNLYTMNYPGWGVHNVLMHFKCKHANNAGTETTLIEFEQNFKSKEGERAGNLGDFIFLGLKVPSNGLQFEVETVNVSNDGDELALKALESDTIKNGLDLVNASFSTLAPFSDMAKGMLGLLLSSNKNKIVQRFTLGFDFDTSAVSTAKLNLGTYLVTQVKSNEMPLDKWVYQRSTGLIVSKDNPDVRLPFNHITFNILEHIA